MMLKFLTRITTATLISSGLNHGKIQKCEIYSILLKYLLNQCSYRNSEIRFRILGKIRSRKHIFSLWQQHMFVSCDIILKESNDKISAQAPRKAVSSHHYPFRQSEADAAIWWAGNSYFLDVATFQAFNKIGAHVPTIFGLWSAY